MREKANKKEEKEEHLYPVFCPAQFHQAVTPISPVEICSNFFFKLQHIQLFLPVTILSPSFQIKKKKTSNTLRLLVWIFPLILSPLFFSYFFFINTL